MGTQAAPIFDKLYRLAESQFGFFTASQARTLGYSPQLQSYYVTTGDWLRKRRGIFQLRHFPKPPFPAGFYVIYLWTINRQGIPEGVFSHGTALYLYNLSTYLPPIVDLTVPSKFHRFSHLPERIQLYRRELQKSDCQMLSGLPVTTPFKTIIDLLDSRVIDYDYILDGLKTALHRLSITTPQMKRADLSPAQKERLIAALQKVGYNELDEIQ